jgi:hypothetical protein
MVIFTFVYLRPLFAAASAPDGSGESMGGTAPGLRDKQFGDLALRCTMYGIQEKSRLFGHEWRRAWDSAMDSGLIHEAT